MSYLIGVLGAVGLALLGAFGGFDRDRGFYPTILMVVASYYVLFSTIDGSAKGIAVEAIVMAIFVAIAIWGVRRNVWIAVAGLAGHGLFDSFHAAVAVDASAPVWWPAWCLAFDVTAAAIVAYLLVTGRIKSRISPE